MRGHIILNKENKEGFVYVPEAELQFKTRPGGNKGWVIAYRTNCMPVLRENPKWIEENFDFAAEVDVSDDIVLWVFRSMEKERRQGIVHDIFLAEIGQVYMQQGETVDSILHDAAIQGRRRVKTLAEIALRDDNAEGQYAMALQVQRWIYEAGGLN